MAISQDEKRRYQLNQKEDAQILNLIHELERIKDLDKNEEFLLQFLRTQLEDDWRKPCLDVLNEWRKHANFEPEERWGRVKQIRKKWWTPNRFVRS